MRNVFSITIGQSESSRVRLCMKLRIMLSGDWR